MATSTSDAAMILRNCVKIEQLVDPIPPVEAILRRCSTKQVPTIIVGILVIITKICVSRFSLLFLDYGALWH